MLDVGCMMSDESWVSFVDGMCVGVGSGYLIIASILNGASVVHVIVVLMSAQNHCRYRLLLKYPVARRPSDLLLIVRPSVGGCFATVDLMGYLRWNQACVHTFMFCRDIDCGEGGATAAFDG